MRSFHAPALSAAATVPFLTACTLLAACADDPGPAPSTVRDSAGVAILEYPTGAEPRAWTLSPDPALSLGGLTDDPARELYQAMRAVRLDHGRVAVANQGTEELRIYGPDGGLLRSLGRKGGGPGEYREMGGVARFPGDTLAVWDWTAKRVTIYDPAGELARVIPVTGVEGFIPRILGPLGDRALALTGGFDAMAIFASGGGVRQDSVTVLVLDLDSGAVTDSLGPYPGAEQFAEVTETSFWTRPLTFGRNTHLAVDAGAIVVGDDRTGEIRWYDARGRLTRILRLGPTPHRVTDQALARYEADALDGVQDDQKPEARQRLAATPVADRFPTFDQLFADREGRTWIRRFDPEFAATRTWVIIDSRGHPAGTLAVPEGFRPVDAARDFAMFRTRDDLDVERILLFDLGQRPER